MRDGDESEVKKTGIVGANVLKTAGKRGFWGDADFKKSPTSDLSFAVQPGVQVAQENINKKSQVIILLFCYKSLQV